MHGKKLSSEQRERIIGAYFNNVKQNVIASQLNISTSTVNNTIKRYKQNKLCNTQEAQKRLLTGMYGFWNA